MGVHRKIRFLDGFTKKKYIGAGGGGLPKKRIWKVCRFKRELDKKRRR